MNFGGNAGDLPALSEPARFTSRVRVEATLPGHRRWGLQSGPLRAVLVNRPVAGKRRGDILASLASRVGAAAAARARARHITRSRGRCAGNGLRAG